MCNESMAVPSFSIYFPLTWKRTWKRNQLICRPPAADAQASPRLSESFLTILMSIIQLARWSAARRRFCLLRASCGRSVLGRGPGKGWQVWEEGTHCGIGNSERGMPVLLCRRLSLTSCASAPRADIRFTLLGCCTLLKPRTPSHWGRSRSRALNACSKPGGNLHPHTGLWTLGATALLQVKRCNCTTSLSKDCGGTDTHRLLWGFSQWR